MPDALSSLDALLKQRAPGFGDVRAWVVFAIMSLFAFNNVADFWMAVHYTKMNPLGLRALDTLQGALYTSFAAAWGYYLGNSSATALAREQVSRVLAMSPPPVATTKEQPGPQA